MTEGPWHSFAEAQNAFDCISPGETRVEELPALGLSLTANPNVILLNYSDVLRRFVPVSLNGSLDIAPGVLECIAAKAACQGYEIEQRVVERKRYGNFWVDFLNFERKVDIAGWRFQGILLVKDNRVIYKLSGGQPVIREREENRNPLGPLQGIGESHLLSAW
ncbi:hypothetical protein [Niveibacterium terrae]|uniref:hypothetical protein n=1 Tax=Niveibacterium terrae TaxID=3373598 RepID=UPI003A93F3D6